MMFYFPLYSFKQFLLLIINVRFKFVFSSHKTRQYCRNESIHATLMIHSCSDVDTVYKKYRHWSLPSTEDASLISVFPGNSKLCSL